MTKLTSEQKNSRARKRTKKIEVKYKRVKRGRIMTKRVIARESRDRRRYGLG